MVTAIYSALSMRPVKRDIAMTGEITLRGKILPIGGLKEKSMAAYSCGIKKVFIPKDNLPNLEEVDPTLKENVEFIPVEYFTEVLDNVTVKPIVSEDINNSMLMSENTSQKVSTLRQ